MNNLSKIIKLAVESAWPGLLPEYNYKTSFLCDTKFPGFTPAMARVSIHVVNDEGMIVRHLGEEQVTRIVEKVENGLGAKADHVTQIDNSVFLYWLDSAALPLGEILTEDNPRSFRNILKNRNRLMGKVIKVDIPPSYRLWINDVNNLRRNVPCLILDITEDKDMIGINMDKISLKVKPFGDNVTIEDTYIGDKHDSIIISGYPFEELDYVLCD